MRISDWSSDVCSSDLHGRRCRQMSAIPDPDDAADLLRVLGHGVRLRLMTALVEGERSVGDLETDRKSVVYGKSVSVRVDLGGPRIIKKNKTPERSTTGSATAQHPSSHQHTRHR